MENLTREQMKSVIEGRGCAPRAPMTFGMWVHAGMYGLNEAEVRRIQSTYPSDIETLAMTMPDAMMSEHNPDFVWVRKQPEGPENQAIDACVAIEDLEEELDGVLENFPDPHDPRICLTVPEKTGTYRLAIWWYCFFERFWSLRGMENALMDFYLYPDEVHRLFQRLTDFYMVLIERAHDELGADGVFTSDDIGTQTAAFFSLDIFQTFFKPYYKQLIDKAHSLGMHFWLHSCGNIEAFLPDFIEIGLDVLHPIQKHTMDEVRIADEYGDKICIWSGFDVQQTIPYGTPKDVRAEVRHLIDTFARQEGRFILTAGNNSTPDWPLESIRALYDEAYRYGTERFTGLLQGRGI